MKKVLCAARRGRFLARIGMSALVGAALLGAALLVRLRRMADPDPAAGPANPAAAAPAAKGGGELEEIVVTAEKRESTVQATPIA